MALLPVGENPKWWPAAILENVEWTYFWNVSCDSFRVWFYGRIFGSADRMSISTSGYTKSNNRGRQPSCIILNGHISERVHPIRLVFGSRVKVWDKIMREE